MKKTTRIRLIILILVLMTMIFTSTVLAGTTYVIRFTVVNNGQFPFHITLYGAGGKEYSLNVAAYDTGKLFIDPGEYSYYMEACNYTKYGKFDLSTFQTLHVPVCGGRAEGYKHASHHIDLATILKPVRVTIDNETGENVGLYLRTLNDHHFLNFTPGESMELILRKEADIQYVYSFQACGGQLISGYYTPAFRIPLVLECP